MNAPRHTRLCLALCLSVFGPQALAAEAEEAPESAVTAEAKAVYERMRNSLRALKQYSVSVQSSQDEVLDYGYKLQRNSQATLDVQPPMHLKAQISGETPRLYVYDGKTLTLSSLEEGYYAQTPAPATLKQLVNGLIAHDVEIPLIDFLSQGLQEQFLAGVKRGLLVGSEQIDGQTCDHLAFREPNIDWQLWVSQGQQALPCKLVITTRYTVGDPQYQATMKWKTDVKFAADHFTFVAGKGATRIPFTSDRVAPKKEPQP
ncbi:DUF2092 domain-containing protein [Pseudomonas sp. M30-35]|uniref:DUF2092 domain-containing protein n=1 Tax=Pseudomonas sp. M30-35 TaxID=1981174 RepID=UPI000B3C9E7F|nr:DUF2092 domain-containing protein [Pseudomonas sp. M30-35]ARU86865.1 hypothetical protein B9K09_02160 [Pseudomonas sp. M30-35]